MWWDAIKHSIGELEEIAIKLGSFVIVTITIWQMIKSKLKQRKRRRSRRSLQAHRAKSSRPIVRTRRTID